MTIDLRYTDTTVLHAMARVLDILHADNDYFLNIFRVFRTMSDDDFDGFVSGCAATLLDINADLGNTRLVEYVISSEIDNYERVHDERKPITFVIEGTDPITGGVMRTNTLVVEDDDRTSARIKRLMLGYRNNNYDIHVRIQRD